MAHPHRPITSALFGLLALTSVVTLGCSCASGPYEELVPPPEVRYDPEVLAEFASAGIEVPRTVVSGESARDIDLAGIRRSFALASPLSEEEKNAITADPNTRAQFRASADVPDFPGDRIRVRTAQLEGEAAAQATEDLSADLESVRAEFGATRAELRSKEALIPRLESARQVVVVTIPELGARDATLREQEGQERRALNGQPPAGFSSEGPEFLDAAEAVDSTADYPAPSLGLDLADGEGGDRFLPAATETALRDVEQRREIAEGQVARLSRLSVVNNLFASASKATPAAAPPKAALSAIGTTPRLGKVLFNGASGAMESLVPRAMRVVVFVDGPRARTTVDLVFENPHDRSLQGTFYYPLPDGASPAAFGMFPGTRRVTDSADLTTATLLPALPRTRVAPRQLATLAPQLNLEPKSGVAAFVPDWKPIQEARVVEQKTARRVYEAIVRGRVDPALLEWSGGNTFKARVFPIEPRGLKRVVLTFEHTLPREGDHLRYTFPLPADERLGEVELFVHTKDPDALALDLPPAEGALREPSGTPFDVDDWTRLRFVAPRGFEGALDLAFLARGPQVLTGPIEGLGGQALFARVRPQVPDRERTLPTGKALFVLDTSLSEEGVRRALSAELLLKVLAEDPTITDYAVLLFDVRPRWLHAKAYRRNTKAAREETAAELSKIYLEGATHFAGVLDEVEREANWLDEGSPATRFLLSDGLITWGNDRIETLLGDHPSALAGNWFTYRFGDVPVNGALFAKLSRASEGRTVNVLNGTQLSAAARAHRKAPVRLEAVRLAGSHDLVVAGDPEVVFPGQTLDIAARWTPGKGPSHLELVLEIEGVRQLERVPVTGGTSLLAPRAWAELWTGKLLALGDERLHAQVVALSQAFGLANSAASLLILESEGQWKLFKLDREPVDLEQLASLRAKELSQRLDRLQGLSLDGVPLEGRVLIRILAALRQPALKHGLPLLERPLAGGSERLAEEVAYRKRRATNALEVETYDRIARARALAGDILGAVRSLSCLVEQRPRSAEANRLVAYACLALGQYGPAAELFERVRSTRPFEGQSYLEEALALEALGRVAEAARNYEIVLARPFPRDQDQVRTVARLRYARLLARVLEFGDADGEIEAHLLERESALGQEPPVSLQLSIHWNSNDTDVDLWVVEPEGERCFYSHKETKAGGHLLWDITSGYGPEVYRRATGQTSDSFDVLIHYYGNSSARWEVPTAVLYVRDLEGVEGEMSRRFMMRILPKARSVIRLANERP